MQDKLLKKIVMDFAGLGAEKLVDLLFKKQNVNEFLIAKRLNLTINQTRNMLYKLGDEGLVKFIRKKDKKKGGWYTYFWTLETEKGLLKYKERLEEEKDKLEKDLKSRQSEHYYYCKNCDVEYNEENALLHEYTCPECGETLEMKSPEETVSHIKSEIKKIEGTLSQINEELVIIGKKKEKSKERRLKAEQVKKKLEREKRKKEREKEKKKALKGTKAPVKKVKKKKEKKKVLKKADKGKALKKKQVKKKRK